MKCLKCGNVDTPSDAHAYCVGCTFSVRAEIEEGIREMYDWIANDPHAQRLAAWAEYDREHQTRA